MHTHGRIVSTYCSPSAVLLIWGHCRGYGAATEEGVGGWKNLEGAKNQGSYSRKSIGHAPRESPEPRLNIDHSITRLHASGDNGFVYRQTAEFADPMI